MSEHPNIPSVTSTVWDWRKAMVPVPPPHVSTLRKKGLLPIVILGIIASVMYFRYHSTHAWIPSTLCGFFVFITLFVPRWLISIEKGGLKLGHWVGAGLTWILLVPFYYIAFIPLRLILILQRKDPMHRRYAKSASTYWVDRKPITDKKHFEKQF